MLLQATSGILLMNTMLSQNPQQATQRYVLHCAKITSCIKTFILEQQQEWDLIRKETGSPCYIKHWATSNLMLHSHQKREHFHPKMAGRSNVKSLDMFSRSGTKLVATLQSCRGDQWLHTLTCASQVASGASSLAS